MAKSQVQVLWSKIQGLANFNVYVWAICKNVSCEVVFGCGFYNLALVFPAYHPLHLRSDVF